ncbi:MAG: hypothetical protein U0T81_13225 [Saprospiraceae bacterium]
MKKKGYRLQRIYFGRTSIYSRGLNGFSDTRKDQFLMNYRLAYRKESHVNWCEALGTVLANDEIKDGVSERGAIPLKRNP